MNNSKSSLSSELPIPKRQDNFFFFLIIKCVWWCAEISSFTKMGSIWREDVYTYKEAHVTMINSKTKTSGNDEANFPALSQQLCVSGGDFVCYDTVFFNFTKGELTKFMDFTFYLRFKMSQGSFGPGSVAINRLRGLQHV